MIHQFHAIYENGILRPTSALNLPEATEVDGVLHEAGLGTQDSAAPAQISLQQEALNVMFGEVDQHAQAPRNDGLHGRDHDKILVS